MSLILLAAELMPHAQAMNDSTPPVIDVWYGDHQSFGQPGLGQTWVNVLGNASDPESGVRHLVYKLNGGEKVTLSMGPDQRRLEHAGDFNVEIDPATLQEGENTLVIEAINGNGLEHTTQVLINYHRSTISLPFTIDWSKVTNAQDVLQVVDGKWRWDATGIRPVEMGYDRMLVVGDQSWTNYVVTVPVTFYGVDKAAFKNGAGGNHAGISVDMRWVGHSDNPRKCPQPHCGWNPVGDFNKKWFFQNGADYLGLKLQENEKNFPQVPYQFKAGHTYIFKTSVRTTDQGNDYKMKVWEQGTAEPDWMFERVAPTGSKTQASHGGFALVAHYTDVSFGNITVTPIP